MRFIKKFTFIKYVIKKIMQQKTPFKTPRISNSKNSITPSKDPSSSSKAADNDYYRRQLMEKKTLLNNLDDLEHLVSLRHKTPGHPLPPDIYSSLPPGQSYLQYTGTHSSIHHYPDRHYRSGPHIFGRKRRP